VIGIAVLTRLQNVDNCGNRLNCPFKCSKRVIGALSCRLSTDMRPAPAPSAGVSENIRPPVVVSRFLRGAPGAVLDDLVRLQHGRDDDRDIRFCRIKLGEVCAGFCHYGDASVRLGTLTRQSDYELVCDESRPQPSRRAMRIRSEIQTEVKTRLDKLGRMASIEDASAIYHEISLEVLLDIRQILWNLQQPEQR
jgi:hypothetical protein